MHPIRGGIATDWVHGRLFQDWEVAVAYQLVKDFQRQWTCLAREEVDDLLQECLSHWVFVKGQYDPKREASIKTFMRRIIRNKLTDLVRERESDKRKLGHLSVSLDAPLTDEMEAPTLMDTLDARAGAVVFAKDSHGLPLPVIRGCFVLAPGTVFPFSTYSAHSFDGRYFGAIPMAQVLGEARPVWTF